MLSLVYNFFHYAYFLCLRISLALAYTFFSCVLFFRLRMLLSLAPRNWIRKIEELNDWMARTTMELDAYGDFGICRSGFGMWILLSP